MWSHHKKSSNNITKSWHAASIWHAQCNTLGRPRKFKTVHCPTISRQVILVDMRKECTRKLAFNDPKQLQICSDVIHTLRKLAFDSSAWKMQSQTSPPQRIVRLQLDSCTTIACGTQWLGQWLSQSHVNCNIATFLSRCGRLGCNDDVGQEVKTLQLCFKENMEAWWQSLPQALYKQLIENDETRFCKRFSWLGKRCLRA
jgi:hypothetical protein